MLKKTAFTLLIVVSTSFVACEDNNDIASELNFRPSMITEEGYKREMFYNSKGQVTKIQSESYSADGTSISTVQEFEFDEMGKISKLVSDGRTTFYYSWDSGRIVSTEEHLDGKPHQQHAFVYYSNGLIKEMLTSRFQESGLALVEKTTYVFDLNGNVSSVKNFNYRDGLGFELTSIYEYDLYDNRQSVDALFDYYTLNTELNLYRNNPGRMIWKNNRGNITAIEDYVYEFNSSGIAVQRETTVLLLHNGTSGSYVTKFLYEEM